jgi:hypothetical protein
MAILDTGIDFAHPDVVGRRVFNQSFVPDEEVQDGHGTHTAGTAAGPRVPPSGARRYGVAGSAGLYVGKVRGDAGSGTDSQILAGMEWAIAQRCQVISMSLGSNDPTVSAAYEAAGQSALQNGCFVVAAAGNNARRQVGNLGFVGRPADSGSIMAVGAVDADLAIGWFSARTGSATGGQVDIAGPGIAVFSSWPPAHDVQVRGRHEDGDPAGRGDRGTPRPGDGRHGHGPLGTAGPRRAPARPAVGRRRGRTRPGSAVTRRRWTAPATTPPRRLPWSRATTPVRHPSS